MQIVFLGTGGGRFNLLKQVRATGGFRIDSKSASIHVDPGPGALLHSLNLGLDVLKLDAVVVTHYHVDHVNDAGLLVEAMSQYTKKRGGILIGSRHTIAGDPTGDRGVSRYHQGLTAETHIAVSGERKEFRTKKGRFGMQFLRAQHDEETTFGFKLFLDGKVIGYTSDTEFYEGLGEAYSGCDYLIVNCLKPRADSYRGHLTSDGVVRLLRTAKPKQAILSHLGMKMIPVAEKEAQRIEKESGVPTIAAKDGSRVRVESLV